MSAAVSALAGGTCVILSVLWHPAFYRELMVLGFAALLVAAGRILPKLL